MAGVVALCHFSIYCPRARWDEDFLGNVGLRWFMLRARISKDAFFLTDEDECQNMRAA